MSRRLQLNWIRTVAAVLGAEAVPILVLFAVVFVYGFLRRPDSMSPEQFAPVAGSWVGPIGGFLATLLFAMWAAKRSQSPVAQGTAVGVGTAILDFGLALLLAGAGIGVLLYVSNAGRIVAGILGGWLAGKPSPNNGPPTETGRTA
ncbi:MAG TPA: hypothetical protein VEI07_09560 [Planctomycetaceae bacterium]|nr:hypothetical protein [Planctomycetaceae bacterium]